MRKIDKGAEPPQLTSWKRKNPNGKYGDLSHVERDAIRRACAAEQFYLCGYCCDVVSGRSEDTTNEHVEAQHLAGGRTVDFSNIIASCRGVNHCDAAHRAQHLPLTPFMIECESEFRFKLSGRIEGLTDRASETIRVLNLGDSESANKALIEKRKRLCDALLWKSGVNPSDELDDEELIKLVVADLLNPQDNRLEAFSPVLANMLNEWLVR